MLSCINWHLRSGSSEKKLKYRKAELLKIKSLCAKNKSTEQQQKLCLNFLHEMFYFKRIGRIDFQNGKIPHFAIETPSFLTTQNSSILWYLLILFQPNLTKKIHYKHFLVLKLLFNFKANYLIIFYEVVSCMCVCPEKKY